MAKNKQQSTFLQKRDWAIIALSVVAVLSNCIWYQYARSQDTTNRSDASAWLKQQVEINKLKACIDAGTRPCDLTTEE